MWVEKKMPKLVLVCSKRPKIAHLNTLKNFFVKMFYNFFVIFMKNAFATIFWYFSKTKRTCGQQKILYIVNYLDIGLKKKQFILC